MRYEFSTPGQSEQIAKNNTKIEFGINQPAIAIRQKPGLGFYGLYTCKQQADLDACINPQGGTFTSAQFDANRICHDLQFTRLLP
jgi:cyanosortase A-associated protein